MFRKLFLCAVVLSLLATVLTYYYCSFLLANNTDHLTMSKNKILLSSFSNEVKTETDYFTVRVSEPFITGTFFSSYPTTRSIETLGKLYDMDVWNSKLSSAHGYQPVLSWETFQQEAPIDK